MDEPKTDPPSKLTLEDVRDELVALLHDVHGDVQTLRSAVASIADDQSKAREEASEARAMAARNRVAGVRSAQVYLDSLNGAGGE